MIFSKAISALALFPSIINASPFPISPKMLPEPSPPQLQSMPNNNTLNVADKYIVTLKHGANLVEHLKFVNEAHTKSFPEAQYGQIFSGVSHQYQVASFQAYSGHFARSVVDQLRNHDDVEHVESDAVWSTAQALAQPDCSYNLGLISHRSGNSTDYRYDSSAGQGTFAYIIDTGIDVDHPDFERRATTGHSELPSCTLADTNGHGTAVAGIIGSKTYGIAKRTSLISVKVLDGAQGSLAAVLGGLDWAVKDIATFARAARAVINLSLTGPRSHSLNAAIDAAVFQLGITIVVAAGNAGANASCTSPASACGAIAVGATDARRVRASWSNFGGDVALFAPGVGVPTLAPGNVSVRDVAGTSIAAAHVAGIAVYFQGLRNGTCNAGELRKKVMSEAVEGVVVDVRGSANLFAYNGGC